VTATFAPPLAFQISGAELSMPSAAPPGVAASFPQLTPVHSGSLQAPIRVVARLSLLGRTITVARAREMSVFGMVASMLAAIIGFAWTLRRRQMDETSRIHAAHGHELIKVSSSPTGHGQRTVDVDGFATLGRLARRYDCVILELSSNGGHNYFVECGTTVYRWATTSSPGPDLEGHDDLVRVSGPEVPAHGSGRRHRWRPMSSMPGAPYRDHSPWE
jgi:hypothetical protein